MNFYILDNHLENVSTLRELIENDFNNVLVGITDNPERAYNDLLQLRVDIMVLSYDLKGTTGVQLISKLKGAHSNPHFIMTSTNEDPMIKTESYQAGCDFFLDSPLNFEEAKHTIRYVATQAKLIGRLSTIYDLSSTSTSPYQLPQSKQRQQMDHVNEVLRFIGIASDTGSKDIRKIIRLMIDQNLSLNSINFERDFNITDHKKKVIYQRIRRELRVGVVNLAAMCMDYPENDILLEYANNLFDYQNIHIEIQRLKGKKIQRGQVSIQHFFDGLLQESFRGQSSNF
ncbi:response regulator [Levilactobacillus brevis]|uniref:DNA-binding domain-containing protein n=1 Tax=Levilactobacillus TaxID=2767886 RepID=UPI001C1EB8C5|nr:MULTISPECIES: DNA-binding domain-containing protein [Levilactobacillus]MBU7540290.1 DNA-binding domain-containing protein [Levilactobacillus brevis]MBU7566504.1 DNA-binding domain-containing protein [Levilactobacillus brevis]MCE6028933.1 response regulator [Levilactobacillus brevis]MCE6039757.1 response regulator [Levilactobacillus brevis]MCT3579156.1 response regulator [Levilactobacillus brevis]